MADWAIIAFCIFVCERFSYWLYPVAFVVVGSRFHALEGLFHDATHFRLHKNKLINDIIGEVMVWPMGISLYIYRKFVHFPHHRFIGTRRDGNRIAIYSRHEDDYDMPKTRWDILRVCGNSALRFLREEWLGQIIPLAKRIHRHSPSRARSWTAMYAVIFGCIVIATIVFGWVVFKIYLLFFVLPMLYVAVVSRYLRLLADHFGIPGTNPSIKGERARTVMASWPIRVMFWPHNLNYHLEHHWYPSVPYYNLPELHRILYQSEEARKEMHVTRGVRQLFRELTTAR